MDARTPRASQRERKRTTGKNGCPVSQVSSVAALGRENHLSAGSDGGGERWAGIGSPIETAKLNGVAGSSIMNRRGLPDRPESRTPETTHRELTFRLGKPRRRE